jgi:iron complex outermembrane receptor protein
MRTTTRAKAVESQARSRTPSTCSVAAAVALAVAQAAGANAAQPSASAAGHATALRIAQADRNVRINFNIPQQPLGDALAEWSRQSGLQVLRRDNDSAAEMTSATVTGQYSPAEALERILAVSGLQYEFVNDRTVRVSGPRPTASAEKTSRSPGAVRLAFADSGQGEEGATPANRRANSIVNRSGPAFTPEEPEVRLEEVLVTGSHIRGVTSTAAPSLTITQEEIERGGYSTLEGVFRDLPQNFSEVNAGGINTLVASRLGRQNVDQSTSIDLRGLGVSSTLVLLNGSRRAASSQGLVVDVSTIPVSVVERIEVATGGRSAIYGADAVAGVVNVITRRSFSGTEFQSFYGWREDGGETLQTSVMSGTQVGRASIVAAYDYSRAWSLNLLDTGLVNPLDSSNAVFSREDYVPDSARHSAMLSGRFELNDAIELFGDVLYTARDLDNSEVRRLPSAPRDSVRYDGASNDVFNVSLGSAIALPGSWRLTPSVALSRVVSDRKSTEAQHTAAASLFYDSSADDEARLTTGSMVADGPLFSIGSFTARGAIGAEFRTEKVIAREHLEINGSVLPGTTFDVERDVSAVFAELLLPVVTNGPRGLRELELSLAGRYDDYSDFGSTFNPQFGVLWRPADSLRLRSSFSKAYRPPSLSEIRGGTGFATIEYLADPANGGTTPLFNLGGTANTELKPESARVWSVSLDYTPPFIPQLELTASYFDIEYDDRLEHPTSGSGFRLALVNEHLYPGLIDRNPTEAEVQALVAQATQGVTNRTTTPWNPATQSLLDAFPNLVTFRNHLNNIAVDAYRAVDFGVRGRVDSSLGAIDFNLNATRVLDYERRITVTSPVFSIVDQVGRPAGFRARATLGWRRGGFSTQVSANYTDDYVNTLSVPQSEVASWTTVGLTATYDTSERFGSGAFSNLRVSLGLVNAFDRDPPRIVNAGRYYFDLANASADGRQVSLRLVKRW